MNTIERLEKLAKTATARPWRHSEGDNCIDVIVAGPAVDTYYGGYVVAESVDRPDLDLIVAAVNALPDLLKLARAAESWSCAHWSSGLRAPQNCWTAGRHWDSEPGTNHWPREKWCARCTALEPLFREVQP